jgi:hypothetical protein
MTNRDFNNLSNSTKVRVPNGPDPTNNKQVEVIIETIEGDSNKVTYVKIDKSIADKLPEVLIKINDIGLTQFNADLKLLYELTKIYDL